MWNLVEIWDLSSWRDGFPGAVDSFRGRVCVHGLSFDAGRAFPRPDRDRSPKLAGGM